MPRLIDDINRVAPVGLPQRTSDIVSAGRALQLGQVNAVSSVVAALAGVSCLVAAITSATTTGASLASRRRTWALARCIGASKRHIAGLVAVESLVLGLLGALAGVLGGLVLARVALPLVGLVPSLPELRGSSYTVTLPALLIPPAVAVALALLGAVVPAWLAARIPPAAALKASTPPAPTRARTVPIVATVAVIGGAAAALRSSSEGSPTVVAAGVLLVLVGTGFLMRPFLASSARLLAGRSRSTAVTLGLLDVVRRPRAAAIEAVAVTLAVAMIALSWVTLSSVQSAASERLSASPLPDLVVGAAAGSAPIAQQTVSRLGELPGVATATGIPFGRDVSIRGRGPDGKVSLSTGTAGADARALGQILPGGFPVDTVRDDTVYLPVSGFPPFNPDSRVTVKGPDGRLKDMRVQYVKGLDLPSFISTSNLSRISKETDIRVAWLALSSGTDRAKTVDQVTGLAILDGQLPVGGPAILDVRSAQAISTGRAAALAILSIAVIVSVIGAAATAALSLSERTHEHATLRALGLPRRSLGTLLGTHVLFVAGAAALLGLAVGTLLGAVASRLVISGLSLQPQVSFPMLPVLVVVVATVAAVRVAALVPLERASYIPPSRALAQS